VVSRTVSRTLILQTRAILIVFENVLTRALFFRIPLETMHILFMSIQTAWQYNLLNNSILNIDLI
jgi:hypothetical protein